MIKIKSYSVVNVTRLVVYLLSTIKGVFPQISMTHRYGYLAVLICSMFSPISYGALSNTLQLTVNENQWLNNHPKISVAFDGHFPPYSFINDKQRLEGFSVDLFNLLEKKIGIKFTLHPQHSWDSLYNDAQQKKVDVVATLVKRAERQQWFNFTPPYIFKSQVIITRENDLRINTKDALKNKKVALVKDYHYVNKVLYEHPSVIPIYVETILEALNAVAVGDADAAITSFGAGHYFRNKYLLTNLRYAAIFDKESANSSIGIRKDWPQLSSILGKALASIPEYKLHKLREKWLPIDYMEELTEVGLTKAERDWIKVHPIIRLGVDPEYAPFEYIDKKQYKGMASDYIKLLNQRLGLNMYIVDDLSWEQSINGIQQGKVDVLPVVSITPTRKKFLSFTDGYLNFHRVIVTRDEMPLINGLKDLKNYVVATQPNTSHHEYVLQHSAIEPKLYDNLQQALLAVSSGEADAYVGNVASSVFWIRNLNLNNLKIATATSTQVQSLHFGVRKDWPQLVTLLQKGLDSISLRQKKIISEKWLSIEYSPSTDYRLIWQIVGYFSLLVFAFILWNLSLNRKVKKRTSQLSYSANYDQLTDLPNRFLILDRLKQNIREAQESNQKVAIISIDIDNFKMINNLYGHEVGDLILHEFASRLKGSLQSYQDIGRISGNQFLMIQSHIIDADESASLAEKILTCTKKPFAPSHHDISINASLGITLFPNDGNTAELLLKHADTAMQHAKKQNQGSYIYYTEHLNHDMSRKLVIEKCLHNAIQRNEFEVYFQPKLEPESQKTVSFEALLRWTNEELGSVSPTEFIPIAEKSEIINDIGFFVITQALSALEQWQSKYNIELSIAINLSPAQFKDDNLLANIEALLNQYKVKSSTVEFEITEGVLLTKYGDIEDKLMKLESLGVSLAMDDFGTGYSSLSYLRKYRFNTLKIDREFIAELPHSDADKKLVAAIIAMAHVLGMKVVAEGVETKQQYAYLLQQNCDLVQGWLFSKALSFNDASDYLEAQYSQPNPYHSAMNSFVSS